MPCIGKSEPIGRADDERTELILATLTEAFEPLMKTDAAAFRT